MRLELKTRNLRATIANIYAADASVQRRIRAAVQWAGEENLRVLRATVPIDSGFMHDTAKTEYSDGGLAYETGWDAQDFPDEFYPPFVELGTRFMAARPSLYPAFREVEPKFQARLREEIRAAIRRRSLASRVASDA